VARLEVRQIRRQGARAVEPGRGKGVWKDEQLIADAHQAGQTRHCKIAAPCAPEKTLHIRYLRLRSSGRKYKRSFHKMQGKMQKKFCIAGKLSCNAELRLQSLLRRRSAASGAVWRRPAVMERSELLVLEI